MIGVRDGEEGWKFIIELVIAHYAAINTFAVPRKEGTYVGKLL